MSDLLAAPFEYMMAADDRPSHPMTFYLRAELSGVVDQEAWRAATQEALRRHPLLSATLAGDLADKTAGLKWRVSNAIPPAIFWLNGEGPAPAPFGGPLDPTRESAVRIFVRQAAGDTPHAIVTLQLHHAATDAAGATAFLEDILCHYAGHQGAAITPRPLVADALTTRGDLTSRYRDLGLGRVIANLDRIIRFFITRPAALAGGDDIRSDVAPPASTRRVMTSDELAGLRRAAKRGGGTLNDLLLRDLFVTLAEWNERRGEHGPIRLSMPINMRELGDQLLPACNIVSMCFLDRRPTDCREPDRLLTGIVNETTNIKTWHLGTALLHVLALVGRVKGLMPRMLSVPPAGKAAATAVLSNLGRVLSGSPLPAVGGGGLRVGDLTLESIELLPPVRPGTAIAIGCVTFADQLFLSLHYDASRLGPDDATMLLTQFTERLSRSVAQHDASAKEWRSRVGASGAVTKVAPEARLWSLPIGKNVHPAPLLPERLPPAPTPERTL